MVFSGLLWLSRLQPPNPIGCPRPPLRKPSLPYFLWLHPRVTSRLLWKTDGSQLWMREGEAVLTFFETSENDNSTAFSDNKRKNQKTSYLYSLKTFTFQNKRNTKKQTFPRLASLVGRLSKLPSTGFLWGCYVLTHIGEVLSHLFILCTWNLRLIHDPINK